MTDWDSGRPTSMSGKKFAIRAMYMVSLPMSRPNYVPLHPTSSWLTAAPVSTDFFETRH